MDPRVRLGLRRRRGREHDLHGGGFRGFRPGLPGGGQGRRHRPGGADPLCSRRRPEHHLRRRHRAGPDRELLRGGPGDDDPVGPGRVLRHPGGTVRRAGRTVCGRGSRSRRGLRAEGPGGQHRHRDAGRRLRDLREDRSPGALRGGLDPQAQRREHRVGMRRGQRRHGVHGRDRPGADRQRICGAAGGDRGLGQGSLFRQRGRTRRRPSPVGTRTPRTTSRPWWPAPA